MATNKSHLQLKLVKTKKGTYVSRWVDPHSGQKGPVVKNYSPGYGYAKNSSLDVHKKIVDLANAGDSYALKLVSLAGVDPADKEKLAKLVRQALAHVEEHKDQAAEHLADPQAPIKPVVPKWDVSEPGNLAKTSDPAKFKADVAELKVAIKNHDVAALQALAKKHNRAWSAIHNQEESPSKQQKQDAAAHEDLSSSAHYAAQHVASYKPALDAHAAYQAGKPKAGAPAVGMTPPKPAAPKPAAPKPAAVNMAGAPQKPAHGNGPTMTFLATVGQAAQGYEQGKLTAIEALKAAAEPYPGHVIEQPAQQYQQKLIDWLTKQIQKPAATKKPAKGLGDMLQGKIDKQAGKASPVASAQAAFDQAMKKKGMLAPNHFNAPAGLQNAHKKADIALSKATKDLAAAKEQDLAWSGAPGHRKHAEPKTAGPAGVTPAVTAYVKKMHDATLVPDNSKLPPLQHWTNSAAFKAIMQGDSLKPLGDVLAPNDPMWADIGDPTYGKFLYTSVETTQESGEQLMTPGAEKQNFGAIFHLNPAALPNPIFASADTDTEGHEHLVMGQIPLTPAAISSLEVTPELLTPTVKAKLQQLGLTVNGVAPPAAKLAPFTPKFALVPKKVKGMDVLRQNLIHPDGSLLGHVDLSPSDTPHVHSITDALIQPAAQGQGHYASLLFDALNQLDSNKPGAVLTSSDIRSADSNQAWKSIKKKAAAAGIFGATFKAGGNSYNLLAKTKEAAEAALADIGPDSTVWFSQPEAPKPAPKKKYSYATPAQQAIADVLAGGALPYFPHKEGQPMHVNGNSAVKTLNDYLAKPLVLRNGPKDVELLLASLENKKIDDFDGLKPNEQAFNAAVDALKAKVHAAGYPAAAPATGAFKAPVDTAKWPAHNSAAVGAAKKVALIEQLANAGDLVSLKAMSLPHNNAGQNSYGKGVNKAHQAALAHLSGDAPAQAAQAAATTSWKPEAPAAEVKAAVATLAPIKALPEPLQGPGVVVGNLCRDEKGHFIPCSLPGAKPVTHGELGEAFAIGIDTQKWKQGHPSVVQTQKKFAALEALVAAGDLAGLEAIAPKLGLNPNNYQKAMAAGHALATAYLQAKQSAGQVALATTPEAPVPVPDAAAPVAQEPAPSTEGWQKVGGQLGSNPGAQLVDPSGQKHYVKYSKSNDHARNEVLAARLLELTGTGVVPYTLVTTKPGALGTATKWTATTSLPLTPGSAGLAAAQLDFATHAWLANWDVVGLDHDNLKIGPDGQPMCVDTGGALLYRAQGQPKGADFKATCPEWDTMRSLSHNSQCAAVFGSMTGAQLVASVEKLEQLDPKLILDAVLTHGPGTKKDRELLAAKLLQRREYLIGKKNALLATQGPTAAASVPAPKPAEPAFNKPAPAAEAPAPTPVAPAFPPTLTEAQLSSKTNPINKKLWGKKVAIDQAVAGFASGQLSAQQALEVLNGPDMSFGVQCYQVKVGKYHADVVAAMQQAAVGAVAAPPAAAGTPLSSAPAAFSEEWYAQQKPAAVAQGPVAAALSPAAQALAAGKAKAAANADKPGAAGDTHAQQAAMLAFPKPPKLDTLSYADKDALGEMNATAVQFKSGKISAQVAYDELNEHGGFNSDELSVYHSKLTDTLENYSILGTSYAEAKAEYSLAWSGLPGHRKHATPEGPSVPTHLAPAPAPAAKAPAFVPPTYLTEAQKKALGADKLAQYESVEWILSKVGHGEWTPATAAKEIGALPYLKSGTLSKWKSQAIDALITHQAVSQSAPAPQVQSQSYQVLSPRASDDFEAPTPLTWDQVQALPKALQQKHDFIGQMASNYQAGECTAGEALNEIGLRPTFSGALTVPQQQAFTALKKYYNKCVEALEYAEMEEMDAHATQMPAHTSADDTDSAPVPLPTPAPAPLATPFSAPIAPASKAMVKEAKDQVAQIQALLAQYSAGTLDNTATLYQLAQLPTLSSKYLADYKAQAKQALQEHYLTGKKAPATAAGGPFSTQGNFVPPTPPTKAFLAKWNAPIQAKFKEGMSIVKKADTGLIGWKQAHNEISALAKTSLQPELTEYLFTAQQELDYAMNGAPKKPEKKQPVFDPAKLSKPVDFLQWGDTGKPGPSSSLHYNTANNNAARLIYKTAQAGDPAKLKELKVMVPDKDTGKNIGSELALSHPSKWVKGYAEQLINEIDEQLNPPKQIRIDPKNPLASLSKSLPQLTGDKAKSASKVGKYLMLGSAADGFKAGGKMKTSEQIVGKKIVFPNPGDYAPPLLTYTSQTQSAWAKMPAQQKAAIKSFTAGGSGAIVNSFWNNNPTGKALAAQEAIMTLGHEIKAGTLLSRGLDLDQSMIEQLKKSIGSVIQEPAITSTAVNPSVWKGTNVQLKITVGPGVKGLYVGEGSLGNTLDEHISSCGQEYEMMLPGGYRMLITKVEETTTKDADGFGVWEYGASKRTVVHCVLLPNVPNA